MYIRGMYSNIDLFKIETNHVVPARGKVLISEPFLCDHMFGRSVILLVDHTHDGTMGLVLNKPLPLFLNDVLKDFDCPENIPIYKGGPLSTDTLFYLHTLKGITGALPIGKGFYLNGDFEAIKNVPSYNSASKFVHQQIFSLIDSESDLLIALLWLSSKVTSPNMVLIFFQHET